jgi:hypothetical protein
MNLPKLDFIICTYFPLLPQKTLLDATRIKNFVKIAKGFISKIDKIKDKITLHITNTVGGKWGEKDINVYLVPEMVIAHSVAAPLMLIVRENQNLNIYFLIHELIHRYFFSPPQNIFIERYFKHLPKEFTEALIILLTMQVYARIFNEKEAKRMREIEKTIVLSRADWLCEKMLKVLNEFYDEKKPLLKQEENIIRFLEEYVVKKM